MAGASEYYVPAEQTRTQLVEKWPGWPGYTVFRMVVPVDKLVLITGRTGTGLEKLMEKTGARVQLIDSPLFAPNPIVVISGKEEPEAALPPAMDAIIRIFKRLNGLLQKFGEEKAYADSSTAFCFVRLLAPHSQGLSVIGKHGTIIKSIRYHSGASAEVHFIGDDESIIELQGEALKVLIAFEAVLAHLRNYLVDESVIPLFEQTYNPQPTEEAEENLSAFLECERHTEPQYSPSEVPFGGEDQGLQKWSSTMGDFEEPSVNEVDYTMLLPMGYAVSIIGVGGTNISYIRHTSGAIVSLQEISVQPGTMRVDISGSSSQVQLAQELIEEFISIYDNSLKGKCPIEESSYIPQQLDGSSVPSSPLIENISSLFTPGLDFFNQCTIQDFMSARARHCQNAELCKYPLEYLGRKFSEEFISSYDNSLKGKCPIEASSSYIPQQLDGSSVPPSPLIEELISSHNASLEGNCPLEESPYIPRQLDGSSVPSSPFVEPYIVGPAPALSSDNEFAAADLG